MSENESAKSERVVVVTQDGMGVAGVTGPLGDADRDGDGRRGPGERGEDGRGESGQQDGRQPDGESNGGDDVENPTELVEQPAKVMRIGSMIKQLLEEVRNAPLDEAGRTRLADVHRRSVAELKRGLAPELTEELDRLALPFTDSAPSEPELRIAQAQLVGWLEGLFHGIQTAIMAQQMAAQAQLQGMRRALPPGHPAAQAQQMPGHPGAGGVPGSPTQDPGPTGQYL